MKIQKISADEAKFISMIFRLTEMLIYLSHVIIDASSSHQSKSSHLSLHEHHKSLSESFKHLFMNQSHTSTDDTHHHTSSSLSQVQLSLVIKRSDSTDKSEISDILTKVEKSMNQSEASI